MLPMPGTYSQSFLKPELFNSGLTRIYGSGCYFGDEYIITTIFRDDLTGHNSNAPIHLNIERKFELILKNGSEWIAQEIKIENLNNTFWLPHQIPY